MSERRKFTDTFGLGDRVAIVRTEHGWFDGSVSGTIEQISDYTCTVEADSDDSTFAGMDFPISRPRDIRLIEKARDRKRARRKR